MGKILCIDEDELRRLYEEKDAKKLDRDFDRRVSSLLRAAPTTVERARYQFGIKREVKPVLDEGELIFLWAAWDKARPKIHFDRDAAEKLGVSVSTIQRFCSKLGLKVKK